MAGAWLTRLARRLLHGETFELVVSPAIADLQFEAPGLGRAHRLRGYLAVGMALGGAICRDIDDDARALCDDAAILATLVALQAFYYVCMLALVIGRLTPAQSLTLVLAFVGLSAGATVLCFWPARRGRTPSERGHAQPQSP